METHSSGGLTRNQTISRSNRGFTLIQVAMAVVILGLLGSLAISKWIQATRKQALIGEGRSLRAVFQEARAYGVKKNVQAGLQFDATSKALRLFEDRNRNGVLDAGEAVRSVKLGKGISFGLPSSGPNAGPNNLAAPSSGLVGAWTQAWTASLDLSTLSSSGAVYLRHDLLPTYTLCLYGTTGSQQCQAAWWDGTSWNML